MSAISARAARRPAGQQRPDRGEVDADRGTGGTCQLDRPSAGQPERLAEERVDRQVERVGAREPGRAQVVRRRAGRPRRGRRRSCVRRRARRRPRSGRSARPATRDTRAVTPSARTASTSARPAASRPTAAMSVDRAPSRPSQRAVLAAEPPWTSETRPGTSVPDSQRRGPARGRRRASGRRGRRSARGPGGRRAPAGRGAAGAVGRDASVGRTCRAPGTWHGRHPRRIAGPTTTMARPTSGRTSPTLETDRRSPR